MKNFLKKLSIGSNHSEDSQNSVTSSSKGDRFTDGSPSERASQSKSSENKPFSTIAVWLNSVTSKNSSNNSPPSTRGERIEPSDSVGSGLDAALEAVRRDSVSLNSRDQDVEEEYQIQLALELSAKEDPEAVQIEAVKQISLGSSCPPENTPAEVVAYRYWNYNALGYDDKILDGFYDLYGIVAINSSNSSTMPSLVDLKETPVGDYISWEAILVDRAGDTKLLSLEQRALEMAFKLQAHSANPVSHSIVQKLANLVSEHMGGPVGDPENMFSAWRNLCNNLMSNHGSMVLPLGSLTIGLARHRALLFKVLADSLDIPCRLVRGRQLTGSDDVAMSFVKLNGGREYVVDLMSDPGTLIPSDAVGADTVHKENLPLTQNITMEKESVDRFKQHANGPYKPQDANMAISLENLSRPNHHARSPSWTEGVSSPAVRRMKAKDASQYMIDAAKDNPQLARKLHDVLLESGVVAPPNLFSDIPLMDAGPTTPPEKRNKLNNRTFLPPLPHHHGGVHSRGNNMDKQQLRNKSELKEVMDQHLAPSSEVDHAKYPRKVPVAAAAAAAAAVVASSMVVAAAKASNDSMIQIPVAAAATATAAAVVATTAAVSENLEAALLSPERFAAIFGQSEGVRSDGEADRENEFLAMNSEGERVSDRSTGNESTKSDIILDDVSDCEIPLEDISMGERIGLGSYGEVYRGDWHGTEVAVKKFLDQELTGESLEEFKSEVLIMRRVRHPNVVLFMGAITRPPNLSIVTEFLPRGSLYRLIHRPNNQLDERRRMRMALDTARGMNYLHNCTPMIVHRDLKTPNLLVDKNWVVKVCDFGLSRLKHSTFLSSRSTAGTAEWMAPEVLRNEPSNEKCDVYSFGVILWELFTLQQPWGGMNPMQVVGAVGFQHRRLDIPDNMDPVIGDLIMKCWQTDPKQRPSFAEIMSALKPLQKPVTNSPKNRGS